MPKPRKRTRLSRLTIKEVSLVPEGDNPPARVVLAKAKQPGAAARLYSAALESLRKALGHEPSESLRKELYDQVVERRAGYDVMQALRGRIDALSESFWSILFGIDGEGKPLHADREGAIQASAAQFVADLEQDAGALLEGRLLKLAKGLQHESAPPDLAELEAALHAELTDTAAELTKLRRTTEPPHTQEDPNMSNDPKAAAAALEAALAKLPEADRTLVQAELAKAATPNPLEAALAKLPEGERALIRAALSKGAPPEKSTTKTAPEKPEPIQGLSPEAAAAIAKRDQARDAELAKLREEADTQRAELAKLRLKDERAEFAKGLPEFAGLAVKRDEVIDLLFPLPAEPRAKLIEVLKASSAAAERLLAGGRIGFDGTSSAGALGPAHAELEAKVAELRKTKPDLSPQRAELTVLEADRDLYRRLDEERRAAIHAAH